MKYDIALCSVINEIKSARECVLMYNNLQRDTTSINFYDLQAAV